MSQKIFRNDEERAVAYAAYKQLERMLKQDGKLPPGFYQDVTNMSLTLTFPRGTTVERDRGTNGDGTIFKRATQNLYGFTLWATLIRRLRSFNQWEAIRRVIVDCMAEVIRKGSKAEEEFTELDPTLTAEIAQLRADFPAPPRCEETPRTCKDTGLPTTLTFRFPNRRAA